MIHRTWSARATAANLDVYVRHFHDLLTPALSDLPGFRGATILQRAAGDDPDSDVEIVVTTRWESMDAIRRFAGEDVDLAVVEPTAAAVLVTYDPLVRHYTVTYELDP